MARSTIPRRPSGPDIVPLSQFEGLSLPIEPSEVQKDMGAGKDFMIGEKRETPKVNTQDDETPTISTSSPASTLEPVDGSLGLPCPSTIAVVTLMLGYEFLR